MHSGKYLTPMEALVDVRFVDYGNADSVPRSQLKSAHPALMKVPVFAIRCSLRGVSCNDASAAAAQTFMDKLCGESQVCIVIQDTMKIGQNYSTVPRARKRSEQCGASE